MVRGALSQRGDDGTRERSVKHFVYPRAGRRVATEREIVAALAPYDMTMRKNDEEPGLVFEYYREVASAEFDAQVVEIEGLVRSLGWEYDGWESAVSPGQQG